MNYTATDLFHYVVYKLRYMFYLVPPEETMYERLDQVPRYVVEMFPFFVLMGFLENAALLLRQGKLSRLNDNVASLSQGIFQECLRINVRSIEVIVYVFVFDNFRMWTLPWNSYLTWFFCFIFIDFGFYWAHRIAHEINFIWAIHQAHHSGEDFRFTSALRQAVLQPFTAWFTYVPLALCGIPPSIFLAHLQLGELYMFWLHTEVIKTIGPLEYILNTPSHHRVHHGRNPKYIDKNYSGVFIIWDRMFGTFEAEDPNEPVVYGLVHPVQSYNPFYLQYHHWAHMYRYAKTLPGWKNKLSVIFKGPGWQPGKPRLGNYDEIPKIQQPYTYWDPEISLLTKAYVIVHFALVLLFYHELTLRNATFSQGIITSGVILLLVSITSIGFILEGRWFAPILEAVRCGLFFIAEKLVMHVAEHELNEYNFDRKWIVDNLRLLYLISCVACSLLGAVAVTKKVLQIPKVRYTASQLSKRLAIRRNE